MGHVMMSRSGDVWLRPIPPDPVILAAIGPQTLFKYIEMRNWAAKRKSKQKDDTSEFKVRETLDHYKLSE